MMELGEIVRSFILLCPVLTLAIKQSDILEETLPDSGHQVAGARLPYYRTVLDLRGRQHIRFALKAGHSSNVLLSENQADCILYNSDIAFIEISIGGWFNTKSIIRIGTMEGEWRKPCRVGRVRKTFFELTLVWSGFPFLLGPIGYRTLKG